jgi:quercetin dioxygenase-like cupin family protein
MTEPAQIVRDRLLAVALDAGHAVERVEVARIALAPRQQTGRHHHPCPVVGYVAAGAIRFQVEGQAERVLGAGDAFHEPLNARIAHFDNASDTERAIFIAFYLLPPGEDRLIVAEPAAGDRPTARRSSGDA